MTVKLKKRTLRIKDPGSAITHFVAMLLAAAAAAPLLLKAWRGEGQMHVTALAIFILSMVGLYGASTIYHTLDISPKINRLLRKIDHMMIFILIAGTYTPVCMGNRRSGHPDQRLLDHLPQVVLLPHIHRHGLGVHSGHHQDHPGPAESGISLAFGRRHHLHPGGNHLCHEAPPV